MKIGIIGSSLVGSTTAYALEMRGIGREIVLIDVNKERAMAEADDIRHAVPFAYPLEIRAGDYSDLKGSRLVIIAAGFKLFFRNPPNSIHFQRGGVQNL